MPKKTVFANDIVATDTIEFGGTEMFITDVVIDMSDAEPVRITMHPIGVEQLQFTATLFPHWPTTIRRK